MVEGVRESEREPINYWLLDENGKTLARTSSRSLIANITKNFIIYTTQDELMNVAAYCMKRVGKESDDLAKFESK